MITDGGFGWWGESNDVNAFGEKVKEACKSDLVAMGAKSFKYLEENYGAKKSYEIIIKHFV